MNCHLDCIREEDSQGHHDNHNLGQPEKQDQNQNEFMK